MPTTPPSSAPDPLRDALLRSDRAPQPRTLVDILHDTAARYPDEAAVDNGAEALTYTELMTHAEAVAAGLVDIGVEPGDRVGVRIPSGTTDLYVAIVGILVAGCAYVPVDRDDPDERARTVFGEADVAAVITAYLVIHPRGDADAPTGEIPAAAHARDLDPHRGVSDPSTDDDAWIIFTSGSTGTPKGVAVTHRNAAAFVDAESHWFLQDAPIGPDDRVMAGLSVAFDASCEEMWLAWRYGACLVPAPRSLVRSGMDLGPWLKANDITIVSTVPTLVALWPADALAKVRLLIMGGEALPPEIAARLATPTREVWNTYGPTEATVVACGTQVTGDGPVSIGLPLDGWDLAVVDKDGNLVGEGGEGELIIGGVGLARYLDPAKDAEKYAPHEQLGWERAYRSGDLVRAHASGLMFLGRADDQVKVGGRRIELGEIDSALLNLPGVSGAAAAVRKTGSGNSLIVGYVTVDDGFDAKASADSLRQDMPAALVPRLAVVDTLPTRTSGKVDRDALPWPLPGAAESGDTPALEGTEGWLQEVWSEILGATPGPKDDFFDLGGGSLTAAQLVARLRERHPEVTIGEVYDRPTVRSLAAALEDMDSPTGRLNAAVRPVGLGSQITQLALTVILRGVTAAHWLTWIATIALIIDLTVGAPWLPQAPLWALILGWLTVILPLGRMAVAVAVARLTLLGVTPGTYGRGSRTHLRIWFAERFADEIGATALSSAPFIKLYARLLGAQIGKHAALHSLPPITGMLRLGKEASIEPEVDLRSYWIDGDRVLVGPVRVRARARVGARSTLLPGADVGKRAEVAPGSAVFGKVPDGEAWSGAPAVHTGVARGPWSDEAPINKPAWRLAYWHSALILASLPIVAIGIAVALGIALIDLDAGPRTAALQAFAWLIPLTLLAYVILALLVLIATRLLGIGLTPGGHPVYSRQAWQAWSTIRLLDEARTWLFPLYSSTLTPLWLRALGARIGKDVEASTTLMIPKFADVGDGAFLADDTLVGGYELGGGWLRVERVKIGKRAFIGNSGMAAPGRKVPKQGLVAVLSAAPRRTKAKSGTSWLGSPPQRLRRESATTDSGRTFAPPMRLRVARAIVETCRLIPMWAHAALSLFVVIALIWLMTKGVWVAVLLGGPVFILGGAIAAAISTAAKWLLVGRMHVGEHPLWSSFVWRNELADTFVEVLAAPWFARAAIGTPVLTLWYRAMGAKIGRGVWCDTYWLPEADLIELRDGATVNLGCVVQTHLFHDRVLQMDTVVLKEGATLGPNGVILPAATIGRHATVGPASLVMRGESIPDGTRWIGNPIGPWIEDDEVVGSRITIPGVKGEKS